jgi:hypothetical protein
LRLLIHVTTAALLCEAIGFPRRMGMRSIIGLIVTVVIVVLVLRFMGVL